MKSENGESFTDCVVAIIEAAGRNNIRHLSLKRGDIDIEFVMNGEVALTPSSNLYPTHLEQGVENKDNMYDNGTDDEELVEEPNLADLALEDPELYEQVMKEQLDG
jgi:hypothetical protein